jgi:hypothetical protein
VKTCLVAAGRRAISSLVETIETPTVVLRWPAAPSVSDPTSSAIHRGTFASVRDLMIKIRAFITGWNDRCQPFTWTKTADQILTKANRQTTSDLVHQ